MLQNLKRLIFGVPASTETEARGVVAEYLPESSLPSAVIHGAADDGGNHWQPWRIDADGEQWFKRVSADATEQSLIHGEAAGDELPTDEDEDFDNPLTPLESFRRDIAIIESRYQRGEICDADDMGEFGDAEDDQ